MPWDIWLTFALRNPFNDRIVASGSDDGKIFLWEVPEGFTLYTDAEEIPDVSPMGKLAGHSRYVFFNIPFRYGIFEANSLVEKLDRSSLTLRPKISLLLRPAIFRLRFGTLAPARLLFSCSTATLFRACRGMLAVACSLPRLATRRSACGMCARTSPSTRRLVMQAQRTAEQSGWASTIALLRLVSPR